jgi:hypothetical protein
LGLMVREYDKYLMALLRDGAARITERR